MTLNALRLQQTYREVRDAKAALWEEIKLSLPLAVAVCREYAHRARTENRVIVAPISVRRSPAIAKEMQSLLGADLYRRLIEEDTGMCFALFGCCAPVVGPSRAAIEAYLTWEKQLEFQSNDLYMC